jgi:hypothetical protein
VKAKVDRAACRVNGSIQIRPPPRDTNVCLIDSPRPGWDCASHSKSACSGLEHSGAPSGQSSSGLTQPTFAHHLLKVAIAEWLAEIPAQTQDDDLVVRSVSSTEQRRSALIHSLYAIRRVLAPTCDTTVYPPAPHTIRGVLGVESQARLQAANPAFLAQVPPVKSAYGMYPGNVFPGITQSLNCRVRKAQRVQFLVHSSNRAIAPWAPVNAPLADHRDA